MINNENAAEGPQCKQCGRHYYEPCGDKENCPWRAAMETLRSAWKVMFEDSSKDQ